MEIDFKKRQYKIIVNPNKNTRSTTNIKLNFREKIKSPDKNNNEILFIPCINCNQLIKIKEIGNLYNLYR
jgi:hypothetical protein